MTPPAFCGTIQAYEARSPCRDVQRVDAARRSRADPSRAREQAQPAQDGAARPGRPRRTTSSCSAHRARRERRLRAARSPRTSERWSSIRRPPTSPRSSPACTCAQNKIQEAMATAEQALKIAPANREAQPRARHHLRGVVRKRDARTRRAAARGRRRRREPHQGHPASRGRHRARRPARPIRTCARRSPRLYVRSGAYDKAIPLLTDLVNQEPGWQDGPMLLAEAYAGAGRAEDAIAWLEERTRRRSAAAAGARRFLRARAALDRRGRRLRARAAARRRATPS